MTKKKAVPLYLFLILLDQGIKLTIHFHFMESYIPIIRPFFYFDPVLNTQYSWINSMFGLGLSRGFHIMICFLVAGLVWLLQRHLSLSAERSVLTDLMFIFCYSSCTCALIDRIFWNGSLDFLAVKGLFIFDLKDIYIDLFIAALLIQNKKFRHRPFADTLKSLRRPRRSN